MFLKKLIKNSDLLIKSIEFPSLTSILRRSVTTTNNHIEDHEINWEKELELFTEDEPATRSVLEPSKTLGPNDITPYFPPTFNLAAYVNKSDTLKELIKLGVNLNAIEKRKGLPQFLLKLDFEKDIKNHLLFLHDAGIPPSSLGELITKNPLLFKEDIDDLQIRVNYLESKKFEMTEISRIIEVNPFWLMFNTQRIDRRLGYFQKQFKLNGNQVRTLAVKQPKLITYNLEHIRVNSFSIKEEMGFNADEVKELLLKKPRLWMISKKNC